jgi:HK97 family phage major capsid protein
MLHTRSRALIGAQPFALTAARVLERKEGDDAVLVGQLKTAVEGFTKTFDDFKTKNDARLADLAKGREDVITKDELKAISDALDLMKKEINAEVVALKRNNNTDHDDKRTPEQKEYSKQFENFFRYGEEKAGGKHALQELEIKAGMTSQSDPDGGFTVRPEMDQAIDETVKQISPIRDIATVQTIGAAVYKKLMSVHGTSSGWVGEQQVRPQTTGPSLKELDFPAMELYAMPAATTGLLDDSFVDINQWLANEVALEFAFQEGAAFVAGTGVKQPQGFLTPATIANAGYNANTNWGTVGYVPTGASGAFLANNTSTSVGPADSVISLFHALKSPYRKNAAFLLNNTTLNQVRQLKDANNRYLVDTKFTVSAGNMGGVVETLLGKPCMETVDMPDPAANSLSIAFGDWKRAYLIVDRKGIRVLRDPYSSKPYVLFYTTKRVGGGVQNYEAYKLLKFAVS